MRYQLPLEWIWGSRNADIPANRIEGRVPRGLRLFPGFVPESEQDDIAAWIDREVMWSNGSSQGNRLETWAEKQRPRPDWSRAIAERLIGSGIFDEEPDYLHLIQYKAGRGIASHIDNEFLGTTVAGLTLRSSRVFEFRRGRRFPTRVLLMPGDLYVMAGESRYRWEHSVPRTPVDRFRGRDYERTDGFSVTWRRTEPDCPIRGIEPSLAEACALESGSKLPKRALVL